MALSEPAAIVSAEHANCLAWSGFEQVDQRARGDCIAAVERLCARTKVAPRVQIRLERCLPQHIGLGTKSALILAVLTAVDALLETHLSSAEIQSLSGRGGTSGIGVHTFFHGGFVLDAGHPQERVPDLLPSSRRLSAGLPPMLCRFDIPQSWSVWLLQTPGARIADDGEASFFARNTPIPEREVHDTLAAAVHGVAPAVATNDLHLMARAVRTINSIGFKRREVDAQVPVTIRLLERCWVRDDVAAGLSSIGPTIFVLGRCLPVDVRDEACRVGATITGPLAGHNHGYSITYE